MSKILGAKVMNLTPITQMMANSLMRKIGARRISNKARSKRAWMLMSKKIATKKIRSPHRQEKVH
jgi:hypothetical protein